jgi:UDP-N-acetylglucosamine/UDP-N-acetylgalactosamine diphosphorylase
MQSAAPKGMWPVGPASGKPLFQWHAEKVLHYARRFRRPIPFVVMVSDATARATEEFFRWHAHFGLDPTWVRMPCQGSLPPLDRSGRLLLESTSRIATAGNGHGGVFAALRDAKLLDLLVDHGVTTLSYFQVDNPLIRPIDPLFLGLHALRESQITSKTVKKRDPSEKVGAVARIDGRPAVVEYTELTSAQREAKDASGSLLFGQGSIAAHCIDVEFADEVARTSLPLHRASKKVRHVDDAGGTVTPSTENATKFESFLFDAIPLARRALFVETRREDEFSPIKGSEGLDSPETARADVIAQFRRWHEHAGLPLPAGATEVDPSKAPDEAAFRRLHGLPAA